MPIDPCPHCNLELDNGDIFEHFLAKYGDEVKAREAAAHYGATPENPQRFSNKIGVYDRGSDRTIYYKCPNCAEKIER